MKVIINDNAFKGATFYNGQTVMAEMDKEGKPVTGKTGKRGFSMVNGGRVYLSEDQYTIL